MVKYTAQNVFAGSSPNASANAGRYSSQTNRLVVSEPVSQAGSSAQQNAQPPSEVGGQIILDVCLNGEPAQIQVIGSYV